MILLSDEEIKEAYRSCSVGGFIKSMGGFEVEKAIAKAQLKQVVEWGDEPCPHSKVPYSDGVPYGDRKHGCSECWQALKKKVE